MSKIERALISVSDKRGIVDFARGLFDLGVKIISTGGTAQALKEAGIPYTPISDYTGFPEMLDGRVKTLHPKVHGGLLGLRDNPKHLEEMKKHGILPIDLVVVNLYPFEATIAKPNVTMAEAIENIDIGGPTMLRSAAKNYRFVTVVVNPSKYDLILEELKKGKGELSEEFRLRLAREVFEHTNHYDHAIAQYLKKVSGGAASEFPDDIVLQYKKIEDMRYGENPHQKGAFYRETGVSEPCVSLAKQLHGKELSFNNVLDLNAALELVKEFSAPAAVIIKHSNPCGVAVAHDLKTAYVKAYETDPVSAFGGVMGFNRTVDKATAEEIGKIFVEAVIAPAFSAEALLELGKKKNVRLMELPGLEEWVQAPKKAFDGKDIKKVVGGLLVQDRDILYENGSHLKVVTHRTPDPKELESLAFAWKVAKHVKSNAIVFVSGTETVGVGAGQMSRVDSTRIAAQKARKPMKGTVVASDAFFPFRDGVDQVIEAGATAVIQPGGSVRDEEVIGACNEKKVAMVFTGIRHFRH